MRVLVGISGGVDSAVTAMLLKKQGYEPVAVNLRLADKTENDSAAHCAEFLNIEFHSVDMTESFERLVKQPFADIYLSGKTPNPCVICNRYIKFGLMAELMKEYDCSHLATGHYVRSEFDESIGRWVLKKGKDPKKDQSYFLWSLSQEQLSKTLFPLGEYVKSQVREMAKQEGIPCASNPESQDVCFIPDGDCAGFIQRFTGKQPVIGNFVDTEGKILGKHRGIAAYTVGQRKGLGISSDAPLYVLSKNVETNTVVLGRNEQLFSDTVKVDELNWIAADGKENNITVQTKIRYSTVTSKAILVHNGKSGVLHFKEPQRAPSPGQSAVFYDGDTVMGGGIIV